MYQNLSENQIDKNGYERIIQKYIQDVSMEKQRSGSKNIRFHFISLKSFKF